MSPPASQSQMRSTMVSGAEKKNGSISCARVNISQAVTKPATQGVLLQHVARCRIQPLQLVAEDEHLAAGRLEQPGHHIEQSAPQPVGPTTATNSPSLTSRLTF